jgi:hypothetical protein
MSATAAAQDTHDHYGRQKAGKRAKQQRQNLSHINTLAEHTSVYHINLLYYVS